MRNFSETERSPRDQPELTLRDAVAVAESVADLLHSLAADTWSPTLSVADRAAVQAETITTCRWASLALRRAIAVAERSDDDMVVGGLYGPMTRAEALGHFRYLLDAVTYPLS